MLSPESLRRRADEALEKIEHARMVEEERWAQEEIQRLQQIEQVRLEAERMRTLEAENAKKKAAAQRAVSHVLKLATKAAAQGKASITRDFSPELIDEICLALKAIDMQISSGRPNGTPWQLMGRLRKLIEMLTKRSIYELGIARLKEAEDDLQIGKYVEAGDAVAHVISHLRKSDAWGDVGTVLAYCDSQLEPLLQSLPQEEGIGGTAIAWRAKDVSDFALTEWCEVPSWLLSTSGAGLMQRISECMVAEANEGGSQSIFQTELLPLKPARWGQNNMTKFIHKEQPIGVTPFDMEIFSQLMNALGFKAEVHTQRGSQRLSVSW